MCVWRQNCENVPQVHCSTHVSLGDFEIAADGRHISMSSNTADDIYFVLLLLLPSNFVVAMT